MDMCIEVNRFTSFTQLDRDTAIKFAEAGLYSVDMNRAKCAFCSIEFVISDIMQDPFAVHTAKVPECVFVLGLSCGDYPLY